MTTTRSTSCFRRFAKLALASAAIALVVRGPDPVPTVEACGGFGPTYVELTTFDPQIVGVTDGLYFNPDHRGFGEFCATCDDDALVGEWSTYLKDTGIAAKDWEKLLFKATPIELEWIEQWLAGKKPGKLAGWESSTLWKVAAASKDKVKSAVALVILARSIEPFASFDSEDSTGNPRNAVSPTHKHLAEAKTGFKGARDAFLSQRYGFQVLRTLFYQRDWTNAIAFFDKNAAALTTPSVEIAGRARHYLAGALRRGNQLARANLELARIHGTYPGLAEITANEFEPQNDKDWKQTLALAKTTREKTALWRLVGLQQDGLAAAQEILKLDPKSNLVALLLVRELERAEYMAVGVWGPPEPADVAASKKAFTAIATIATKQATTTGADRPWLMQLIAGHVAAKRGDLPAARTLLVAAASAKPTDARVQSQAKASLALALALNWKSDPSGLAQREDEIAKAMNAIDQKFGRRYALDNEVRGKLAKAYVAAGRIVDAEFLYPQAADESKDPKVANRWKNVQFIKDMLARMGKASTEFDKFVLAGYSRPALEQELALRYMLDGDFANASQTFATTKATSSMLQTDPFAIRIVDCIECDHEKYANAKWTHATFAARLAELAKLAAGTDEKAAEAALAIGNAMYNVTRYGNARIVAGSSHQYTRDTKLAERWYKKAYDTSKNRELKAKAAFLAAKAETGALINAAIGPDDYDGGVAIPTPKVWFPVVKSLADTKYYKEVLKECGTFAAWASTQRKR